MYLKLAERLSPRKVAVALLPHLRPEQVDWDYENVYEWAWVDFPELAFSLDVSSIGHDHYNLSPLSKPRPRAGVRGLRR
jgi:hypothetical protein